MPSPQPEQEKVPSSTRPAHLSPVGEEPTWETSQTVGLHEVRKMTGNRGLRELIAQRELGQAEREAGRKERAARREALAARRAVADERRKALEERQAARQAGKAPGSPGTAAAAAPAIPVTAPPETAAAKLAKWMEFQAARQAELSKTPAPMSQAELMEQNRKKTLEDIDRMTKAANEKFLQNETPQAKAKRLRLEEERKWETNPEQYMYTPDGEARRYTTLWPGQSVVPPGKSRIPFTEWQQKYGGAQPAAPIPAAAPPPGPAPRKSVPPQIPAGPRGVPAAAPRPGPAPKKSVPPQIPAGSRDVPAPAPPSPAPAVAGGAVPATPAGAAGPAAGGGSPDMAAKLAKWMEFQAARQAEQTKTPTPMTPEELREHNRKKNLEDIDRMTKAANEKFLQNETPQAKAKRLRLEEERKWDANPEQYMYTPDGEARRYTTLWPGQSVVPPGKRIPFAEWRKKYGGGP